MRRVRTVVIDEEAILKESPKGPTKGNIILLSKSIFSKVHKMLQVGLLCSSAHRDPGLRLQSQLATMLCVTIDQL